MRLRIIGGGWYGAHLAAALKDEYDVELHEKADRLFSGASGGNPARLHCGAHYPRSRLTRAFCQEHHDAFMAKYGHLTRSVPVNVYAIADRESWLDFGTYCQVLKGEIEYITVERPEDFGLHHVEGAILTGERHIVIDDVREYFARELDGIVQYNSVPPDDDVLTIDCTFCALGGQEIDRYEPCLTALMEGPTDWAVTVMDGPFPSIYPWNEEQGLSSLTSARYTPLERCKTWDEADRVVREYRVSDVEKRAQAMVDQLAHYWPRIREYRVADYKLTIRALPLSGSDARLVDAVRDGNVIRVRAGKIDAILHAESLIREML